MIGNVFLFLSNEKKSHAKVAFVFYLFNYYFFKNEWVKSIEALQKSISLSSKIVDAEQRLKTTYDATVLMAEVYAYNGDYVQALESRLQALKIIESTSGNYVAKGEAYVGIINDFRPNCTDSLK